MVFEETTKREFTNVFMSKSKKEREIRELEMNFKKYFNMLLLLFI